MKTIRSLILVGYLYLRLVLLLEDPVLRGGELPISEFDVILPPRFVASDKLAGLDVRAPEVYQQKLKLGAQALRRLAERQFCSGVLPKPTREGRLLQMAFESVVDPSSRASQRVIKLWKAWWDKTFPEIPYDSRLDADRFLEYILARLHGVIKSTGEIDSFEKAADEAYLSTKNAENISAESSLLRESECALRNFHAVCKISTETQSDQGYPAEVIVKELC